MRLFRKINTEKYSGGRGTTNGVVRSEKRKGGRIRCSTMTCELGQVLDLSPTGVRLVSKTKPEFVAGDTRSLTLKAEEHELELRGKCVWVRVNQDCEYEVGFEFLHSTAAMRSKLVEMAATAQASDGLTRGWAPMQWWKTAR